MRLFAFVLLVLIAAGWSGHAMAGTERPMPRLKPRVTWTRVNADGLPGPCSASDSGDSVQITWTDGPGEAGYYLFSIYGAYEYRSIATLDSNTTSYTYAPGPSTFDYCIERLGPGGEDLGTCCDQGAQTLLSTPRPCTLTPTPTGFHFQWPAPSYASGDGYRVYRNGSLIQEVNSGTLSINDNPGPGSYTYCVTAFKNNYPDSAPCCQSGTYSGPSSSPEPCLASEDRTASILLTWTDVQGEDGYQILRDNVLLQEVPKDTTHFLDRGVLGGHTYCVRGFNGSGRTADCCSHGIALAPAARTRLSWNTCSPQVYDQSFQGPGTYTLVVSVTGVPLSNVGHDCQLRIRPKVPDAWRFDDDGCQTGTRLDLRVQGNGPGCPAMLGANPLTITSYFLDLDGSARLRLAVTYDSLSTDTTTRYVLWKIGFDHTNSVVGGDSDSTTCNGVDVPLDFDLEFAQILGEGNRAWDAPLDPQDMPVVWNGGQVRTQAVTWGKVKALYR